jgi:hypothetical protein
MVIVRRKFMDDGRERNIEQMNKEQKKEVKSKK